MARIEQLPEITDHVLSGLRADDSMKHSIYQKAAGMADTVEKRTSRFPLIALCAISAVMVAVFVLLGNVKPLSGNSSDDQKGVQIQTISAGVTLTESPVNEDNTEEDSDPDENDQSDSEDTIPSESEPEDKIQ